ncbi:MAG: TetR/AcrR family transcriptional regulator [Oscillospiraceae bacterium]
MHNESDSRSARRTKHLFKDALMRLLETESFACITVKDIVETAEYNRTTFYNHYYDKFDLLDDITQDLLDGLAVTVKESFEHYHQSHRMALKAADITLFDYVYQHRNLIYICKKSETKKDLSHICAQTIYNKLIEIWTPLVNMTEQQLASYAKIFSYNLVGTIHGWIDEDFVTPPKRIREEFVEFYNHALNK